MAVRSGEEELFKARARETGTVKIIDIISARLDAKTDCYLATLPSLQLKDVSIPDNLVRDNERYAPPEGVGSPTVKKLNGAYYH